MKGLDVYTKGLSTKATHSKITAFLKPSLISWTDPISGTIQPTAMKNTLTSTENEHHGRKNCLGSLRSAQGREKKRKERKKRENKNVALEACIFLVSPPPSPRCQVPPFHSPFQCGRSENISPLFHLNQPSTELIFLEILTRFL